MKGQVRVGFIGVGGIGGVHLRNIAANKQAKIISLCDVSLARLEEQGQIYGASIYTDYREMLEKEELDCVFVSVPPFAHDKIEEDLVAKGIHLLIEKPVELDAKRAYEKGKIMQQSGLIHASGYCLRYLDTVQRAKEYVQGKKLALVRGYYLTSFVPTPWYRVKSQSGGQLVEQSTHILDLMSYLVGDIKSIHADMDLLVMNDIENIDIPDVTAVQMKFKNGAIGQLTSTCIQPDHRMGLEILGRDFRLELTGTDLTIIEKDQTLTYQSQVNFSKEQDRLFIEAVKAKNQQLILASYCDGVKTLVTSLAANHSSQSKETVYLDKFEQEKKAGK